MFHWFINRRRQKLTQAPFPSLWEDIIRRNVAHYCMLEDAERAHLRALIQVFIAEKNWEGAGGLEITDEIRVLIEKVVWENRGRKRFRGFCRDPCAGLQIITNQKAVLVNLRSCGMICR